MKEPWGMTREEYSKYAASLDERYKVILRQELKGTGFENDPQSPVYRNKSQDAFNKLKKETGNNNLDFGIIGGYGHKVKVRQALSEGKPVPPEVLKDYPDLVASIPHEPVKGEQAGMLGVPGKYVEQKRPWRPGQIEIESYAKYKEAMREPNYEVLEEGQILIDGAGDKWLITKIGKTGVPARWIYTIKPKSIAYTPGFIMRRPLGEIERYYKIEAMGKPRVVTPEVTANLNNLLAHLKEAPLSKSSETYLRKSFGDEVLKQAYDAKLITRSPKDIYTITLKGQEVLKAIPKAKAKVELEAMESPEELDRRLREFERKTLKEEQAKEAKELEKILSGMMGKKKKPKVEVEAMKQAEKPSKNLYWYSVVELKKMCQDKGLSIEGSKENLIRRLHNA